MLYYFQYQTGKFLEGDAEYMSRFHRDYEPQDTKLKALDEARAFFERERAYYQGIADRKSAIKDSIPETA